jgi:asparagine synthase (glutamine-hydrolysing)
MSAFFVSINRDGSDFDLSIAQNMMKAISHYGIDEQCLVVKDNFAIGYQSFWTVPEEHGERQPLFDSVSNTWLVFYGRIDNRDDLAIELGLRQFSELSDAKLLHEYLIQFGEDKLAKIIGPFSFAYYQARSARLIAARDGMGGRNLVYHCNDSQLLVASHEMALVGHPVVEYKFNRGRIGRMIAQMMLDKVTGIIQKVDVVEPGDLLELKNDQIKHRAFYRCDGSIRIELENEQAYAEEFRRLLDQSVQRRSRSIGAIGTMMSGGMDSVPISILLAQQMAAKGKTLTALSWVYNRFPEADERQYSTPVCEDFGIEQVCINCDDVWTKFDKTTYVDPLLPFAIPYSEYQQALMAEAQDRGIKTLITGIYGDLLYDHTSSVFVELLKAGRWKDCIAEFKRFWQKPENRSYIFKHYLIAQIPGAKKLINWRRNRAELNSEFLHDDINALLHNETPYLFSESLKARRPEAYLNVFSGFVGEDQALGRNMEAKFELERRYPFRDRDLCEFLTAIPSDQLYFNRTPRPVVRNAFANDFRPELFARKVKTSFVTTIIDGIRNDPNWSDWYNSPTANWQHYVKHCDADSKMAKNHTLEVVQWRCGYYAYWKSVCYNRVAEELGLTNEYDVKE